MRTRELRVPTSNGVQAHNDRLVLNRQTFGHENPEHEYGNDLDHKQQGRDDE
jgi:hypothetical protein